MNASGLMAVSTAEGGSAGAGAQGVRPVSAASRTQTTSGKNLFSDTFDALQKKEQQSKTSARGTAAAKTQNTEASAAADQPSAQDTQDVMKQASTKAEPGQKAAPVQKDAQSTARDAASEPESAIAALAAAAPTDAAEVSEEVNAGLDKALTDILERFEIIGAQKTEEVLPKEVQSLLQRIPEEGLKNFNLLRTLSGEPLAQMNGEGNAPQTEPITQIGLSAQLRSVVLEDILRTSENLPAVAEENKELLAQVTMDGLIENTERQLDSAALQSPAGTLLQSTARENVLNRAVQNVVQGVLQVEETAAPIVQTAVQQPVQNTLRAAQLVGDVLTVEEGGETPSPLDILAQRTMRRETMGQGAQQQEARQGDQSAEQQVPFVRTEITAEPATPRAAEPLPQQSPQPIGVHTGTPAPQVEVPTAPAQEAVPQRPQPDYEIPRQIVEQARLLRTLNDTQMVIRLKPAHLGELTLRVAVSSDGAVQASFHSDNAQVRNVIENSLVQLRQELNNQGLKVDRVGVYTGLADGQMPQGQGQEAWQQSEGSRGNTRVYARGDAEDYEDGIEGVLPTHSAAEPGGVMTADGVDYRV